MKLMLYFENTQINCPITYALKMLVRDAIEQTLISEDFTHHEKVEISVTFADNEGIHAINAHYRHIDAPTDVLSFPQYEFVRGSEPGDEPIVMLGDVVISLERAAEQAEEFGHSFEREVAFLCVHSTLHLLGYDHERSPEEESDMRRRQRVVMERLGMTVEQVQED